MAARFLAMVTKVKWPVALLPMLLAIILVPTSGQAWSPFRDEPLCLRDEVIAVVRQHIRKQNYYAKLDYASVREWPTTDPQLFACSFRLTANRHQQAPDSAAAHHEERYFVQVNGHRFTVRFAP